MLHKNNNSNLTINQFRSILSFLSTKRSFQMSVSTKVKSAGIKITKPVTVKVSTKSQAQLKQESRERLQARRIQEKVEVLDRYDTSEGIFDALISEIRALSNDESSHDLSVRDEFNYGVDYEVDLLLEVIRDLRSFTQYNHCDDDESITKWDLDYLRSYF